MVQDTPCIRLLNDYVAQEGCGAVHPHHTLPHAGLVHFLSKMFCPLV